MAKARHDNTGTAKVYLRKPVSKTNSAYRSLIQKAVRRGSISLTKKVAYHLRDIGDADWLRKRAAVITFEECWPLSIKLNLTADFTEIVSSLLLAAQSVKVKHATGLGTLGYTLSLGDKSVLSGSDEDYHIRVVSEAIKRADDFWHWVTTQASQDSQRVLINVAKQAHRRGGWPWDKAFMQAAAYLAVTEDIPTVCFAQQKVEEFPLWVALDKHTPQGKCALREAAKQIGVPWHQLFWVSFYLESAITNESTNSFWWLREVHWRLHQIGLDYDNARLIWRRARPVVAEILKASTEQLCEELESSEPVAQLRAEAQERRNYKQLELFDLT